MCPYTSSSVDKLFGEPFLNDRKLNKFPVSGANK
jgi:hypothetical protein